MESQNLVALQEFLDVLTVSKMTLIAFFLAAFQFIEVYQSMGGDFKKAVNYTFYLEDKDYYEKTIANFNTTRHTIKPKEDKKHNCLIVEWPKAHEISNGQRDVLSFITLLMNEG
jgi:hypothetical protein